MVTGIRRVGASPQTPHIPSLVWPEIELTVIGQRRKIGDLEGNTGPVQIDLATNTTDPGSDRTIDDDRVAPGLFVMIAHGPPSGIVVEGTTDAGRFRRIGIATLSQPGEAVTARHALLDQRPPVALPSLMAGFHADNLVKGNPDPLFDDREVWRAFAGELNQRANPPADRLNLVIAGALTADHADGNVAAPGRRNARKPQSRPIVRRVRRQGDCRAYYPARRRKQGMAARSPT